ncbi:MAG TPA: energy transducer TonB, partial [Archangium sp.]
MSPLSSRATVRWCLVAMLALAPVAFAGDVVPPEVVTRVEAQLPTDAPPPVQDHVLLEFTVGADGLPSDILVIESAGPRWDQASVDALSKWTFKPA